MKISVIIIAHNGTEHLRRLLPSIKSQDTAGAEMETIILDNASTDSSAEWIAKNHPWITLIRQDKNLRFVGGNNLAITRASGDVFLLLNQDAVLAPGFIREAILAFGEFSDAAALAVNVISPNVMSMETFLKTAPENLPRKRFHLTSFGYAAYIDGEANRIPVNYLSGCGFFIKRSALQPGEPLFDPRLDAYAEDTELSLRLAERGAKIIYVNAALFHNQTWERRGVLDGVAKLFSVPWNRFYALSIHHSPLGLLFKFPLFLAGIPLKAFSLRLGPLKTAAAFLAGSIVLTTFIPLLPYWLYLSLITHRRNP